MQNIGYGLPRINALGRWVNYLLPTLCRDSLFCQVNYLPAVRTLRCGLSLPHDSGMLRAMSREDDATKLCRLLWQMSQDAQAAGERLYAHVVDEKLDGTTEVELMHDQLSLLRTDIEKASKGLARYQKKHGQ